MRRNEGTRVLFWLVCCAKRARVGFNVMIMITVMQTVSVWVRLKDNLSCLLHGVVKTNNLFAQCVKVHWWRLVHGVALKSRDSRRWFVLAPDFF